jgi:hypothetical protein
MPRHFSESVRFGSAPKRRVISGRFRSIFFCVGFWFDFAMASRGRVQSLRGRGGRGGLCRGEDAGEGWFGDGDQHFEDFELAGELRGRPAPRRASGGAAELRGTGGGDSHPSHPLHPRSQRVLTASAGPAIRG